MIFISFIMSGAGAAKVDCNSSRLASLAAGWSISSNAPP